MWLKLSLINAADINSRFSWLDFDGLKCVMRNKKRQPSMEYEVIIQKRRNAWASEVVLISFQTLVPVLSWGPSVFFALNSQHKTCIFL